jgi:sugar/nucleoside kinase (ribokinase family)
MISVLGDIAIDIVSILHAPLSRGSDAGASIQIMPGGSAANVAVWLARLGQAVTFIGRIGDDPFGRLLTDDLLGEGVIPALVADPDRPTGVIQVLVEPDGERTMVPDRGANAFWEKTDVSEELIAASSLLHVVGYVLLDEASRPGALHAMALARKHHVPISLDPSSHAPLQAMGPQGFWSLVGAVDILLPNRNEARMLTGTSDPGVALESLCGHAALVVIKLDRDGCIADDGQQRVHAPAPDITVTNATGAGDAFNAGFLNSYCAGLGLEACCRSGVALGSFAVTLSTTR